MKLTILGASQAQLIAIKKAKELGYQVITMDYLEDAVGHIYGDIPVYVSTFDKEGALDAAKAYQIDGIMTLGTDQPVYTAAYVAEKMNLSTMISEETALLVTNKIFMKEIFAKHKIPAVDYLLYEKGKNEDDLRNIQYPVVVKPVDSQGQRGVFFLTSPQSVIDHYDLVIEYSREKVILVEQYYKHDEITISGWVFQGKTVVLSITDRVTFDDNEHIGICLSHEFPSKHKEQYGEDMILLTERIVKAFNIENGPIYFQYLIGDKGIKVNEIACRIGGAFEATWIPKITGFDICTMHIRAAMGNIPSKDDIKKYNVLENMNVISVQFFFATPCQIAYMPCISTVLALEGIVDAGLYYKLGDRVSPILNATSRMGYAIVEAKTKEELRKRIKGLYDVLKILDADKNNHLVHSDYI